MSGEHFDVLTETGEKTGTTAPRKQVHADGLYHRAVHTWLFCPSTGEVLLQQRASCKDSWPDIWDISSAGHLSAGEESLPTAQREMWEELGLLFPLHRFRYLFTHLEKLQSLQKGKPFINNEFNDVYLITLSEEERRQLDSHRATVAPLPSEEHWPVALQQGATQQQREEAGSTPLAFTLQDVEVRAVRWLPWRAVQWLYNSAGLLPQSSAVHSDLPPASAPHAAAHGAQPGTQLPFPEVEGIQIVPTTDAVSYGRLWPALQACLLEGAGAQQ